MRGVHLAAQQLAARHHEADLRLGTVWKKLQGQYTVSIDGRIVVCTISSRLRKVLLYPLADSTSLHARVQSVEEIRQVDPVAVGDQVNVRTNSDNTGVILEVHERTSALTRRAAGPKPIEQVIVANVDQVVCVTAAAMPAPSWELLDRYLAACEASQLPPLICITKLDIAERAEIDAEMEVYRRIGYDVILTSAVTGDGIDELRAALDGKISVLAGKSGVGKSSLLNAVQPGLGLRVNEVSGKTGKGKHTTTHLEMFALGEHGGIVDTPGMREFALWNVGERELADLFREFQPFLGDCRFRAGCSHNHEPGCAVKAAVEDGLISERRYRSYLRMLED